MLSNKKYSKRRLERLRFAWQFFDLARYTTELESVAGAAENRLSFHHNPASDRVVLVVEDEPLLRVITVENLEEAGFVALQASNADEAILKLESRGDIDLVLTDIQMPGSMDGLKLAQVVRIRWPLISIVVVSGKSKPQIRDLPSGSRFIMKPYHTDIMVSTLNELLCPLELRPA